MTELEIDKLAMGSPWARGTWADAWSFISSEFAAEHQAPVWDTVKKLALEVGQRPDVAARVLRTAWDDWAWPARGGKS